MSQISFVNDYCIDPYYNQQMKKQYLRHKRQIEEIGKKSSQFGSIEQEQQRIIDVVHKSKQISRKFQIHQFELRKSIENKRMMNHLSRFENRKHSTFEVGEQPPVTKKLRTKDQILRQFQINLENKRLREHLEEFHVKKKEFRKKVKHDVQEYQKLRQHMQKFKNSNSTDSGVSNKKMKVMSNRPKVKSRKAIEPIFFKEDNRLTPNDNRMAKSRSLPPLQL